MKNRAGEPSKLGSINWKVYLFEIKKSGFQGVGAHNPASYEKLTRSVQRGKKREGRQTGARKGEGISRQK